MAKSFPYCLGASVSLPVNKGEAVGSEVLTFCGDIWEERQFWRESLDSPRGC